VTARAPEHDRYLFGSGKKFSLRDIGELIQKFVPEADFEYTAEKTGGEYSDVPASDSTRIKRDLEWEASHTIEEAVGDYVSWLRENPEKWSIDPSNPPWNE
jgi:nucleoside-diphosphate-sugar epimerase